MEAKTMKVSILIPVYNEVKTFMDVLELVLNLPITKEILVVDDFSTDGSRELLENKVENKYDNVKVFYHEENKGKGHAIRTAIKHAEGDYVVVQDGDLEYSPHEIVHLVDEVNLNNRAVVYGSRFMNGWRCTSFIHYLINAFLTLITNVLYGVALTDMETCYKMVRTDIIKNLGLISERFEFEPELTIRLLKKGYEIYEVPISYRGRGYDEGKKITWKDGVVAIFVLFKYRFIG